MVTAGGGVASSGVAVVTGGYPGFGKSAFPEDTMTLLAGAILGPQVGGG